MIRLGSGARILGDVEAIPFRSGAFCGVYAVNLLQLVPDRSCVFAEVFRVLRAGGRFALPITTQDQTRNRFINRFFPSLAESEMERYAPLSVLEGELINLGFMVQSGPIDLGTFTVDAAYVHRLRSGILSGLLKLDERERSDGLARLDQAVSCWERDRCLPVVRRIRSMIVAEKASFSVPGAALGAGNTQRPADTKSG